ncbi:hypothetical protein D9615_005590 [Tricholomella constricta]|uniref:Calcineurin-like phosphoesterase domain-containing protein n=1 Tax=Tricholomella constricta TaxID=117010 RepID=A0A8H5HE79_9AGAR|nr:hypothetical protein D9615_005590 [Tricholomella constricta]
MRIQVLSDLHLEFERLSNLEDSGYDGDFYKFDFPARADTIALLGDIGMTRDERLFDWLRVQLKRFKTVLFLSGNHEAYGSSLEESHGRLVQFCVECDALADNSPSERPPGRFILLDRMRHNLSATVTVLGCTLWSRLDPDKLDILRQSLNDFRHIENFNLAVYQSMHERDVAWLEHAIEEISRDEPTRKIVVMTHHAPTVRGTSDPRFLDGPMNSAFATELVGSGCWREQVKVWMFGHTHWSCDFEQAGVRVVSNQRGYRDGSPGFALAKVVEV